MRLILIRQLELNKSLNIPACRQMFSIKIIFIYVTEKVKILMG